MSFGDILSKSWSEFVNKISFFAGVFLVLYVIPSLLFLLIVLGVFGSFIGYSNVSLLFNNPEQLINLIESGQVVFNNNSLLIFIILAFIIFLLMEILYVLKILAYLNIAFAKKNIGIKKSIKDSFKYFWRMLLLIITMLIVLFFLYMLFIIPGIIFSIFWAFAPFILFKENLGVFDSLRKSTKIVKGRWWRVLWYCLLITLILMLIFMLLSFIPIIGGLIAGFVTGVFGIVFMKNFYEELKKEKSSNRKR